MRKRVIRWSLFASCLVLVVVGGILWLNNSPSAFPPVPQPNGYDALTRAASKLQQPTETVEEITTERLATAMDGNAAALEELRRALQAPGAVSVQMSESWFTVHTTELMHLKRAAFLLDGEAELRSRRG